MIEMKGEHVEVQKIDGLEVVPGQEVQIENTCAISFNALNGISNYQTLSVIGYTIIVLFV